MKHLLLIVLFGVGCVGQAHACDFARITDLADESMTQLVGRPNLRRVAFNIQAIKKLAEECRVRAQEPVTLTKYVEPGATCSVSRETMMVSTSTDMLGDLVTLAYGAQFEVVSMDTVWLQGKPFKGAKIRVLSATQGDARKGKILWGVESSLNASTECR